MSELRQADAVQILRCAQENGASVAGVREADGKASFLVKFFFGARQTGDDTIIRTAKISTIPEFLYIPTVDRCAAGMIKWTKLHTAVKG